MPRAAKRKLGEYRRKRDFSRTPEPAGGGAPRPGRADLRFVVQKHAASHLHFDFRLELDGVMKSWAVPKGPSLDPAVKRLAMEVEDHPIEYNTFEGTIPKGEYGGGTVMLWDRGTYAPDESDGRHEETLRREYEAGKMSFTLNGERLHGSFTLVRTRGSSTKPQWLLMKHRDRYAKAGSEIVDQVTTSVDTGRTMDEISGDDSSRVWRSDRPAERARTPKRSVSSAALEPMYASIGREMPTDDGWTFEPKYDGIRVLIFATGRSVKLVTRNGKDKTKQFPEIVAAVADFQARADRPLVLDGEIVAYRDGAPARFQELQARMHVTDRSAIARHADTAPARLAVFDVLLDGDDVLLPEPWTERRRRLERLWGRRRPPNLVLTESVADGERMLARARDEGWEGVIAKRTDAPYDAGARSRAWLKLKIEHRQEFVVGGYTEPRNSREHIGALLLGYFDNDRFVYVGHTGGGFTREGLRDMYRQLAPLERRTSPFEGTPRTNERAHWVTPRVVVEVKFSEWTADGKLRQPIFLGTRDDKDAREVGREPESLADDPLPGPPSRSRGRVVRRRSTSRRRADARAATPRATGARVALIAQLDRIEADGGDGEVTAGRGVELQLSSLGKGFFPGEGYTKGDLARYYVRVAPAILPAIKDRPLVLKRYPNGIDGPSFYQQNAPDPVPDGVRVETITNDQGEKQRRIIGGDLPTLLYIVQLGAISVDPWHTRVGSLEHADYSIIDLDPGPGATFARVVDVARWVKDELHALGLHGIAKTSGASGMHIVVPLRPGTPAEAALVLAQLIATRVVEARPRETTIERSVKARPPAAVYVDYLQNIRGKTVAGVYSVRAQPGAPVSTPLQWTELTASLDPRDFTIRTVPDRLASVGDLWAPAMRRRNSLAGLIAGGDRATARPRRTR